MKTITELTEQEILALTDADITMMIKLAKAEAGIKFISKPSPLVLKNIPNPDVAGYYISILGDDKFFTDIKEITAIANSILNCNSLMYITYESSYGYSNKFIVGKYKTHYGNGFADIQHKSVYSNLLWNKVKEDIKDNEKLSDEHREATKVYNQYLKDTQYIVDSIQGRKYEVENKYFKLAEYVRILFEEYLPLSNNDYTIAMGFMCKAYNLSNEETIYIAKQYRNSLITDVDFETKE